MPMHSGLQFYARAGMLLSKEDDPSLILEAPHLNYAAVCA